MNMNPITQDDLKNLTTEEVLKIISTPEYSTLPYAERNQAFVTAHKLLSFVRCQFCYYLEHVLGIPNPLQDSEALIMGQAFDDMVTDEDKFKERYMPVARRTAKLEEEYKDKILLSQSNYEMLERMQKEYHSNPLMTKKPQKEIYLTRYDNLMLKVELDSIDHDARVIEDVKTTANIVTFYKDMARNRTYLFQKAFYFMVVGAVTGIEYDCVLMVVDKTKGKPFARSGAWFFSREELRAQQNYIHELLQQFKTAHETETFLPAESQMVLYDCPYYGYEGHGRPTTYL